MQHLGFTRVGDPKGKPLAIVHGWGCDSSFLLPIANMFRERDIFLIDLPGYGESTHLAPLAQDLVGTTFLLINTLPDGADLFAWSFGTLYVLRALSLICDPTFRNNVNSNDVLHKLRKIPICPGLEPHTLKHIQFTNIKKPSNVHLSFAQESLQENLMIAAAMHRALHSNLQVRQKLLAELFDEQDRLLEPISQGLNAPNAGFNSTSSADIAQNNSTQLPPTASNQELGVLAQQMLREQSQGQAQGQAQVQPQDAAFQSGSDYSFKSDDCAQELTDEQQDYYSRLLQQVKVPNIHSLVTICGSPRFPADPNWPGINPVRILKLNTELNSRRLKTVLNLFYHMQFSVSNPKLDRLLKRCLSTHPPISDAVLMSGIHQVSYMDERPALEHLSIPSLHMFGAKDRLVPCQIAQFCPHDALHSSYIFPYSAHNPFLTEPEEFEKQIRMFFDRIKNYETKNS